MMNNEDDFIDALNGKIYVMVMKDQKGKIRTSYKMDRTEIEGRYCEMYHRYDECKPMIGHLMYVARASDLDNPLEGTKPFVI